VIAIAALGLIGCGDETVDSAQIEAGIKAQVKPASSPVSKVDCPSDVKAETGATFKCDVTLENGATGKVQVTQTGHKQFKYSLVPGSVQVPGSVVEKSVQQDLADAGTPDAKVNCPDNIIVKLGTTVTCNFTSSTNVGTVTFTFSDASGTVDSSSVKTT
jgi:hypothetical protein